MWVSRFVYLFLVAGSFQYVSGSGPLCVNQTQKCTTQVLGQNNNDYASCTVEYFNSEGCKSMNFGPIESNGNIGGVKLKPHILTRQIHDLYDFNYNQSYTVLNITFSNIKWKTMKFRFEEARANHCRNIVLSNDAQINDQSVLYYDCYWPNSVNSVGQYHILDFEASDDNVVNRGRYYFNIPSAQMLSNTVNASQWKPFVYLEILSDKIRLHIMAPPDQVKVSSYRIQVVKECKSQDEEIVKSQVLQLRNFTDEVTYDYSLLGSPGSYYFVVTPQHDGCKAGEVQCQVVESPRFTVSNNVHTFNICIASISALIVATLFAYYIMLRVLRRYLCRDYRLAMANEMPSPTKVLVIYSSTNRLHAECVASFVSYLRAEFGFEIMYDGDISSTSDQDPYIWAAEAFKISTHVMYIVSPADMSNQYNIYEKPILTAHRNLDNLQLSLLKANRGTKNQKVVINVIFEHSNGSIPMETKHGKVFYLLKEWNKLIAYLSKNLLPKKQIMRTEKGRCLLEDLTKAKKLLSSSNFNV